MAEFSKVKRLCKKWHLKQLICCCLKLSLLSSFVFLASFAFWRREIFLIHKRADLRIKTVVICGQNLGGNWRNAEIMVDADFPEIIYEADFPQTASCGSPRAWEGAKSAVGANTNMSINTNTRSIIHIYKWFQICFNFWKFDLLKVSAQYCGFCSNRILHYFPMCVC